MVAPCGNLHGRSWGGAEDPHLLAPMAITLGQRGVADRCREMVLVLDLCYRVETDSREPASR